MNLLKEKWNTVANAPIVSTIKKPTRSFPLVDNIVIVYAAITMLFQVLFEISPVLSTFVNTPLYKMQTVLGIVGAGLIVLDVFTTKKVWSGKYSLFLYAILFLTVLSSVRMMSYGIRENLFKFCWMAIQFIIIYTLPQRMSRDALKRFIKIVFFTLLAIWIVCCCVSLYQYINRIGYMYVVNPLGQDSSANRQGFYDNRLFGIFYTLNIAANTSLLFFILNFFFIVKEKKRAVKVILCIAELILVAHIILSVSRSAALSLFVCAPVIAWFMMRNKITKAGVKRIVAPIAVALAAVLVVVGGFNAFKKGLTYLPTLNDMMQIQLHPGSDTPPPSSSPDAPQMPNNPQIPVEPEYDETILDRDLGEDYSNERFNIWRDYLSLYKEIGLVGISPDYMPYVIENHPDLFIVEDIKVNYPDKYESGIIYHGHNDYLVVFIATGFLGAASLLAFIAACVYHVIKTVATNKRLSLMFVCAFAIVVVSALAGMLDIGLFFQSTPQTTLFYFALGVLMNTTFYLPECCDETSSGNLAD